VSADGLALRVVDNSAMRRIEVKQLNYDLTPVGGLALVGHYLKALAPQWTKLDAALPIRAGVSNSDVLRSYLGLLVQGKSDFDAVEGYRGDKFFKEALGIELLPSSPTLRQRLDAQGAAMFAHVPGMIERLLSSQRPDYGVLPCGWLPLDVDTFAMDNGGTAKEGVGRTYAGVDGYCPLAAYLGSFGFCLELALRPGVQHSARETDFNLERVIPLAQRLSAVGPKAPILARLDSGFDSAALMRSIEGCNQAGQPQVDWLIKWNPRSVDTAGLLARLDTEPNTRWHKPRAGKRMTVWEEAVSVEGISRPVRRILRLVERDIDRRGQQLIVPEVELEGWTTSLGAGQFSADKIMALYADHGTHEQFHSEFKTDLDLERLPSGKFDTNYLVCQLAALAMDILRLMGQRGLLGPDAPVRHSAKRRRLKTVMQELIYRAGRIIEHGRRLILGLGANDRAAKAFARLNGELFAASS
jgi:Transposase DDE domain group 1